MLGLAVGIDYALFIITRYRQELRRGADVGDRDRHRRRHRRLGRRHRRAHRRHRAGRPVRRRHPVPDPDGRRRGRDHRRRRPRRADPGARRAELPRPRARCPRKQRAAAAARRARRPGQRAAASWPAGSPTVTRHRVAAAAARRRSRWASSPIPVASMQTTLVQAPADGQHPGPGRAAARRRASARASTARSPSSFEGDGRRGGRRRARGAARRARPTSPLVTPPIPNADGTAALLTVVPESGPDERGDRGSSSPTCAPSWPTSTASTPTVTGATAVSVDVAQALDDALPVYLVLVVGLALRAARAGVPVAAGAAGRRAGLPAHRRAPRSAPRSRSSSGAGWPTLVEPRRAPAR